MERLTERAEIDKCPGIWVKEGFANKGIRTWFSGYDEGYSAINKCAEYEDLQEKLDKQFDGCLSIEDFVESIIEYDKQHSRNEKLAEAIMITNEDARQYREWKSLKKQGRLPELPCAVGDMVWDIDFGRPCSYEVTGFSFGSLNDDDWEEGKVLDQVVVYYTNSNGSITGTFAVSEIGKTVFLTRDEAEAALKER